MTTRIHKMTRRSFLSVAAMAPLGAMGTISTVDRHHFHYDHVLGTSLDLVVWSRDPATALQVEAIVLREIQRLNTILNTRDDHSEIRRLGEATRAACSGDLNQVRDLYAYWEVRTGGVFSMRPEGPGTRLNVDALGKAYIIDRAASAVGEALPGLDGLLLNIGGDIVTRGVVREIAIADPGSPYDNAQPLTRIALRNAAVATSGTSSRGSHLLDARNGQPGPPGMNATVIARDAVTANALATTLCVMNTEEALRLVESTGSAEALVISSAGSERRTRGFAHHEMARMLRTVAVADWPAGYELTIALTLTAGQSAFGGRGGPFGGGGGRGGFGLPPQFVAVWVENPEGKLVRVLAFWANNKTRYYNELSNFFNLMGRNVNEMSSLARTTRRAGSYSLLWDGLDDNHKPVPAGEYKIVIETNQEHGTYGKQSGLIACASTPSTLSLGATANFEPVMIQYGPRQNRA